MEVIATSKVVWRIIGVDDRLTPNVATHPIEFVYGHLERFHGIPAHVASNRLHKIKEANRLSASFELLFHRTGNVYRKDTRVFIGSLTDGGKSRGEG